MPYTHIYSTRIFRASSYTWDVRKFHIFIIIMHINLAASFTARNSAHGPENSKILRSCYIIMVFGKNEKFIFLRMQDYHKWRELYRVGSQYLAPQLSPLSSLL